MAGISLAATIVESLPVNKTLDDNLSVPGVAAFLGVMLLQVGAGTCVGGQVRWGLGSLVASLPQGGCPPGGHSVGAGLYVCVGGWVGLCCRLGWVATCQR